MLNKLFNSAILKLTLYYVFIVMMISLSFSFVIYSSATRELDLIFSTVEVKNNSETTYLDYYQITKIKKTIIDDLVILNLFILGVSFIISYFLAKQTLKPINDALESQEQFTSDAAHELRTPLAVMKTNSEIGLMNKNLKIKDLRFLVEDNLKSVDEMERLINQLLILASNEETEMTVFDVKKISENVVSKYISEAAQKSIKINNKIAKNNVKFNEDYLSNLLSIFIENAIKYSPENTNIYLKSKVFGRKLRISIVDEGVGIEISEKDNVFKRFYRIDKSRCKNIKGNGLGLSIAKKISDKYDLHLDLKSEKNKGTEIFFDVPLAR